MPGVNPDLLLIMFEVVSALGTVGLSLGLTPSLLPHEQLIIIITMFLGRVGPLSLDWPWPTSAKGLIYIFPKAKS